MNIKKQILFLIILGIQLTLGAFPIMHNVKTTENDGLRINWNIDFPEQGMEIKLAFFHKTTKELITITPENIQGDFGKIEIKENYSIFIKPKVLPDQFSLNDYIIFPKMLFQEKIFYEMEKISAGSYPSYTENNIIEMLATGTFYVNKFEITNEQFSAFLDNDGYQLEEFWEVSNSVMSKTTIGWTYNGSMRMSKPEKWNFADDPYYKNAPSNFIYAPITYIRWFEANAYCNWVGGVLPDYVQFRILFGLSKEDDSKVFDGITITKDGEIPLQKINGGVSEWIYSGEEPSTASCVGCNEMFVLKNSANNSIEKMFILMKCPLFREDDLGFRYIIYAK